MKKTLTFAAIALLAACAGEKKEEAPAVDSAAMAPAPAPAPAVDSAAPAPADSAAMPADTTKKM